MCNIDHVIESHVDLISLMANLFYWIKFVQTTSQRSFLSEMDYKVLHKLVCKLSLKQKRDKLNIPVVVTNLIFSENCCNKQEKTFDLWNPLFNLCAHLKRNIRYRKTAINKEFWEYLLVTKPGPLDSGLNVKWHVDQNEFGC